MSIKQRITDDMKSAMRAGDKRRLGTIRLALAAIKQIEVDQRLDVLSDEQVIATLDKMLKQRRESLLQYQQAGRDDLAEQEAYEMEVLQPYLPAALDPSEIAALISSAIDETGATGMKDMGKVMAILKPKMQGKADMAQVSAQVKQKLSD